MTDEIILPDDQHAAEKVNVDLWRSRSGTLFNSEDAARYDSSTHRRCDLCDAVCEKSYTICSECRRKEANAKHATLETKPWDESSLIFSDALDEYFSDIDMLEDALHEHGLTPAEARLLHCEPLKPRLIDPYDLYADDMPEDEHDLAQEIIDAFDSLNKVLITCAPISYYPGKIAVCLDSLKFNDRPEWLAPSTQDEGSEG